MFVKEPVPPKPIYAQIGRPPAAHSTAEVRECSRHGWIEHHLYSRGSGKPRRWRCKRCVGEAVTRRHHKVRGILIAEAGGRCAVCGYDRLPSNLHFHHVDPNQKQFDVNPSQGKALAKYQAEARKCVLVCANCPYEIEAGLIACPPLTACWPEPATPSRPPRRAS